MSAIKNKVGYREPHREEMASVYETSWNIEEEDVQGRRQTSFTVAQLTNTWKWEGAFEWNF